MTTRAPTSCVRATAAVPSWEPSSTTTISAAGTVWRAERVEQTRQGPGLVAGGDHDRDVAGAGRRAGGGQPPHAPQQEPPHQPPEPEQQRSQRYVHRRRRLGRIHVPTDAGAPPVLGTLIPLRGGSACRKAGEVRRVKAWTSRLGPRTEELREQLLDFMTTHVDPALAGLPRARSRSRATRTSTRRSWRS